MLNTKTMDSIKGIIIAGIVINLWIWSLIGAFSLNFAEISIFITVLLILWQTFLYTGLFITAHDAMHGVVFPINRKLNNFVGTLAVKLYALFSFPRLLAKHWEHHKNPASEDDPDFHDGEHQNFWQWYGHFMKSYVTWKQILGMAIAFNVFRYLFDVPTVNLLIYWITPALLSTLQLFYFGTYLPHRELETSYSDKHHARSNDYSVFLSFITCYHFGYHWEHHQYPFVPWWRLPKYRRETLNASKRSIAN